MINYIKSMFEDKKYLYIALIAIIVVSILGLIAYSVQQTVYSSSNTFIIPQWARIECGPEPTYNYDYYAIPTDGVSLWCGGDREGYTNECTYYMNIDSFTLSQVLTYRAVTSYNYRLCDVAGTLCGGDISRVALTSYTSAYSGSENNPMTKITNDQKLFAWCENQYGINLEGCTAKKEYYQWKLYRYVGGAKFEFSSAGCYLDDDYNSKIPKNETYPNPLTFTGGEGSKWINYVDDWAYGPGANVYTHPTYGQVYCTAGRLYSIATIQMKDGKLYKIDPSYTPTGDEPEYFNSIGTHLANVECCPQEPGCTDDFKFDLDNPEEIQCFTDAQCFNAGGFVPTSSKCYVNYFCNENDICEMSEEKCVECTNNAACPSGQICDLSTTNYGNCIQTENAPYCGDQYCSSDESSETCPADCGIGGATGPCTVLGTFGKINIYENFSCYLEDNFTLIAIFILVITTMISYLMLSKKFRREKGVNLVLSLIIGIFTAYFYSLYWWAILIAIFVIIGLRLLLGAVL